MSADEHLNQQQFSGPWRRAEPRDKDGNSLYPQSAPDYDSVQSVDLDGPEHFASMLKSQKMARRYDADTDTFKRTKVDHWMLHGKEGSTRYPAGWDGPVM